MLAGPWLACGQGVSTDGGAGTSNQRELLDVGDLPTCNAGNTGKVYGVQDATSATDCSVGGGGTYVVCECDGTTWFAHEAASAAANLWVDGTSGIYHNTKAVIVGNDIAFDADFGTGAAGDLKVDDDIQVSGDSIYGAGTTLHIRGATNGTTDNMSLYLSSGPGLFQTQGAYIMLGGNESADTGYAALVGGDAVGGDVDIVATASGESLFLLHQGDGNQLELNETFLNWTSSDKDPFLLGQGIALQFTEDVGVTPNIISVKASATVAADWTLTLPDSAGTNNYVLTTNGSGVTSWSDPSSLAGSTQWAAGTNGLWYNGDGVIVGDDEAWDWIDGGAGDLHVDDDLEVKGGILAMTGISNQIQRPTQAALDNGFIQINAFGSKAWFYGRDHANQGDTIIWAGDVSGASSIELYNPNGASGNNIKIYKQIGGGERAFEIDDDFVFSGPAGDQIQIGTSTVPIDMHFLSTGQNLITIDSTTGILALGNDTQNTSMAMYGSVHPTNANDMRFVITDDANEGFYFQTSTAGDKFKVQVEGGALDPWFEIDNTQFFLYNVPMILGNTTGGLWMEDGDADRVKLVPSPSMVADWTFTFPVNAGTNDYVLTTNGSGVTAWEDVTTLGTQPWINGTNAIYADSDNVTVGSDTAFESETGGVGDLRVDDDLEVQGTLYLAKAAGGDREFLLGTVDATDNEIMVLGHAASNRGARIELAGEQAAAIASDVLVLSGDAGDVTITAGGSSDGDVVITSGSTGTADMVLTIDSTNSGVTGTAPVRNDFRFGPRVRVEITHTSDAANRIWFDADSVVGEQRLKFPNTPVGDEESTLLTVTTGSGSTSYGYLLVGAGSDRGGAANNQGDEICAQVGLTCFDAKSTGATNWDGNNCTDEFTDEFMVWCGE